MTNVSGRLVHGDSIKSERERHSWTRGPLRQAMM